MLPNLKLYAFLAFIIMFVVGIVCLGFYMSNKAIEKQAGTIASLQAQVQADKKSLKVLEDDSLQTAKNQTELFGLLDDIRTNAKKAEIKIVIPPKVLHAKTSAPLEKFVNDQTKARLKSFEVLTGNVTH